MPDANGHPTETSPLLAKGQQPQIQPLEAGEGIAPDVGITHVVSNSDNAADDDHNEEGGDLERQTSGIDRTKQYEGIPEVRARLKYILPALATGIFLSAADQTIIVSSYGEIGSDLHALNRTSWIATAYFLTLTSFQPLYGKMSDIFGRKSCLIFGYVVFGLGCLFCGLAQNINQLIAARAFAGIGGGGMTTVVSILLSDVVPLRERGKWQGYLNIVYATGSSCGAPLGGIFADQIGWRWSFLVQTPLCLVAIIAVSLVLKLPQKDDTAWRAKLKRIDFLGATILTAAVFALLLGLDRGSNVSWKATITIVSLCVSIPLFAFFVYAEIKIAAEPFAPGHVIFNRSLFACYLCNFFAFGGWLAALFYIPLYFQAVDGLNAAQAGVRLIPSILCGVSGSLFAGFYMARTGKYYWITVGCYSTIIPGMAIILLCSGLVVDSTLGIILGMCICAFSNGIGVTTSLIGLIANATHEDQAVATACSYLFRSLGSVFGVSVSASVANQALRTSLQSELSSGKDAAEIAEKVRQSLGYLRQLEPSVRAIVVDCYAKSTRAAFTFEVVLVAGAAVSAWWVIEKPLSR